MENLGKIAMIGSGSWATALAKLLLDNNDRLIWYFRNPERIDEFIRYRRNPGYLSDVVFDTARIDFTSDIDEACLRADTLVIAVPSPYVKAEAEKITTDISVKNIVSAVKGIVPDENMIVTDWFADRFGCDSTNLMVIGGPCHAEEVALERLSYLTIGAHDQQKARAFARCIAGKKMQTIISSDVDGIEYAAVLKNVYAIAGGVVSGMKMGDNFMAMLACNAAREMRRFIDKVSPMENRDICLSAYLGDLLVTAYSRFSRNHNFGSMIGKGYSVKAAMMEMEMVAEGYYGTRCMHQINKVQSVEMPIMECMYSILYQGVTPRRAIRQITTVLE